MKLHSIHEIPTGLHINPWLGKMINDKKKKMNASTQRSFQKSVI